MVVGRMSRHIVNPYLGKSLVGSRLNRPTNGIGYRGLAVCQSQPADTQQSVRKGREIPGVFPEQLVDYYGCNASQVRIP